MGWESFGVLIIGPRGLQCETNFWMSWAGNRLMFSDLTLGPLLQIQTMVHWLW